jgi:hypothetical protein
MGELGMNCPHQKSVQRKPFLNACIFQNSGLVFSDRKCGEFSLLLGPELNLFYELKKQK